MQGAEKLRSAAYVLYASKEFFTQRRSWDEMLILGGSFKVLPRPEQKHSHAPTPSG